MKIKKIKQEHNVKVTYKKKVLKKGWMRMSDRQEVIFCSGESDSE